MSHRPRIRYVALQVVERPWRMRVPFHYGVVTLHEATELHLSCAIELEGTGRQNGHSAELAAPKWFNKDPALTPAETVERLRDAVNRVTAVALDILPMPFDDASEAVEHAARSLAGGAGELNDLEISFALALLERATIDAMCRGRQCGFSTFLAGDGLGLARRWPHGGDFEIERWLASLRPSRAVAVRHTIGLSDPLTRSEIPTAMIGSRPVALEDVIAFDGIRHFKIKIADDHDDLSRLRRTTEILVRSCPDFAVSLDANEAFSDVAAFAATVDALRTDPALAALWARVRYIEQPFHRDIALHADVHDLSTVIPLLIDESDDRASAFVDALAMGYRGVSIKTCKGTLAVSDIKARSKSESRDRS